MRTAFAILAKRIMELAAGAKLRDSRNTRTQIFSASVVAERRYLSLPLADWQRITLSCIEEVPVTTYRFTIQGEITAESGADAYQAVSEMLARIAEAHRSDALLRFDLADNLRITFEPLSNSHAQSLSTGPPVCGRSRSTRDTIHGNWRPGIVVSATRTDEDRSQRPAAATRPASGPAWQPRYLHPVHDRPHQACEFCTPPCGNSATSDWGCVRINAVTRVGALGCMILKGDLDNRASGGMSHAAESIICRVLRGSEAALLWLAAAHWRPRDLLRICLSSNIRPCISGSGKCVVTVPYHRLPV